MSRIVRPVAAFLIGLAVFTAGLLMNLAKPSPGALQEAEDRIMELEESIAHLEARPAIDASEFADLLPARQSVDAVLAVLNDAARNAHVGPLTLSADEGTPGAGAPETPFAPDEDEAPTPGTREPGAVRCTVELETEFAAMTRFLALVENARPIVRVESLQITPLTRGLRAKATLAAFYFAGEEG